MPNLHHAYGPSSLKNRRDCPGWSGYKDGDETFAEEGEQLHHAAETGVLDGLNEEQKQSVSDCLSVVTKLEEGAVEVHKELRLQVLGGLTFGTADRVIIHKAHAELVDFKFGRNMVDPAEVNLQGWAYALGVFERWPKLKQVRVWFLLPRLDHVSKHVFTRADIPKLEHTVRSIIAACEEYAVSKNEAFLRPSVTACEYCETVACPFYKKYAAQLALKYAPLEVPDEVHSSAVTDPSQMSILYSQARVLERFVDSVKKNAMRLAQENGGVLTDRNGNPVFEVGTRAGARSLNLGLGLPVLREYLDDHELLSVASVPIGKALDLIHDKAPRGKKGAVVAEVETKLSDAQALSSSEGISYLKKVKAN